MRGRSLRTLRGGCGEALYTILSFRGSAFLAIRDDLVSGRHGFTWGETYIFLYIWIWVRGFGSTVASGSSFRHQQPFSERPVPSVARWVSGWAARRPALHVSLPVGSCVRFDDSEASWKNCKKKALENIPTAKSLVLVSLKRGPGKIAIYG